MKRMFAAVRDLCLNPRCPWCHERTWDLETHMHVDHAGEPGGRP